MSGKKAVIFLVKSSALTLLISVFIACGGSGGGSDNRFPTPTPTAAPEPTPTPEPNAPIGKATFHNPLLTNGADPWLEYYEGNYYLLTTTWTSQLVMRKSPTLAGLTSAKPFYVWSDDRADRCCNFWAFEMHQLTGPDGPRWYIMYTAGHAPNLDGQKLRVLESASLDPMGPYTDRGTPLPNRWNIDGTYLELQGDLFLLWSEWVGPNQSTWIAQLSNPWTVVAGSDTVIATPDLSWEIQGGRVNEAPEVLQHNGRTFVTFSASSCNTQYYKLGLLTLTGADPLQPSSWTKTQEPVFEAANNVFGPGHNGFFKSPDGTEDWLVYHGNELVSQGCGDTRMTRAQPITYDNDGTPVFGEPAGEATMIDVPSGEMGPITADVQGVSYRIVNREHTEAAMCLGVTANSTEDGANISLQACTAAGSAWALDATTDGFFRLVNSNSHKVLDVDCAEVDGANVQQTAWLNTPCQQWELLPTTDGWFHLMNRVSGKKIDIQECGSAIDSNIQQRSSTESHCQQWRMEPMEQVAITNVNSGKVLEVEDCGTADGTDIKQQGYLGTDCQKWTFTHTDSGFYRIQPVHSPSSCMVVQDNATSDEANIHQAQCSGANSEFKLAPHADGTVSLHTRDSDHAVDIAFCSIAFGGAVGIYSWLDNDCQKFNLIPVP